MMTLSIREVILARGALKALERVGDLGLSQEALLSQAALESETHLLTSVEGQALMRVLVEKRWINHYTDPLTGVQRWWLSDEGRLALRAL